jgi:hypothetical protein
MVGTKEEGIFIGKTVIDINNPNIKKVLDDLYILKKYMRGDEMGHDIYAKIAEIKKDEIAYLRKNTGDSDNGTIYKLLDCEDCNGGVSGNGRYKLFSKEQIKEAIEKGQDSIVLKDNLVFLRKCLKGLKKNQMVYISFC